MTTRAAPLLHPALGGARRIRRTSIVRRPAIETVTVRRLGSWATAWDDLVADMVLPSPFMRSWWLEGVGRDDAEFVLVLEGDKLLGGLAVEYGQFLGVPRIREIGAGDLCPDHVDLVAQRGREDDVVAAIAYWFTSSGPRMIDMMGVAVESMVERVLPHPVAWSAPSVAPWIDLRPGYDAYLAARSGELRETIRRGGKRLAKEGISHRVAATGSAGDRRRVLDALGHLHREQWREQSGFTHVFPRFAAAADAGMAAGEVIFHELARDDLVIASMVTMHVAGRLSYYQAGRSVDRQWRSAGTVLLAAVVKWAAEAGCTELDLLRGGEDYKESWATDLRLLVRLRAAYGRRGRASLALADVAERTRLLAGPLRDRLELPPRLRPRRA